MGTNFSSIICKNCSSSHHGFLSPLDPTASTTTTGKNPSGSKWQCDICGESEAGEYVNTVIKSIGEELLKLDRGSVQVQGKRGIRRLSNYVLYQL